MRSRKKKTARAPGVAARAATGKTKTAHKIAAQKAAAKKAEIKKAEAKKAEARKAEARKAALKKAAEKKAAEKKAAERKAAEKRAAEKKAAAKKAAAAKRAATLRAEAEKRARIRKEIAAKKAALRAARATKLAARKAAAARRAAQKKELAEKKAAAKQAAADKKAADRQAAAEKKEAERRARAERRAADKAAKRAAWLAAHPPRTFFERDKKTPQWRAWPVPVLPPAPDEPDEPPPAAPTPYAVLGPMGPRYGEILTAGALAFLTELHRRFEPRRQDLLAKRAERQKQFDAGALPDFLAETKAIRDDTTWRVAPVPDDLLNRRVEITGPVDRKMIINALNSGATHYMADFEDANAPTWSNCVEGQINLKDRFAGTIDFTEPGTRKRYAVGDSPAVLIVRPRGWHLDEAHVTVDGAPVSASLFDFGLAFIHNAQAQIARGGGPYFYLPKLESHLEARLWNDVFLFAQQHIGIWTGVIRATVLIETLPAAFEMEEILYELRDHIAGMNAGRWDYIFSFIKTFAKNPDFILPDRSQVVMGEAFLGAYAALLVETCHRRGAFAMGGMAAQIPVKGDEAANAAAFAKVRADKEREVDEGYDGTWVAHPDLVPVAKEVFDRLMPQPNQVDKVPAVAVARDDLLKIHDGQKTDEGFRLNLRVGVQYIAAWLGGRGAVPIYNLMEDAATAEICRAQIWQWLRYGAELDNGIKLSRAYFERAMHEEMQRVRDEVGARVYAQGHFAEAEKLFRELVLGREFVPFLTIPAYRLIV